MQNIKIQFEKIIKVALLSLIGTSSLMALDISTYYDLDIKAMQMTLEGSKERLSCMKNACPQNELYAIDDRVQEKISLLYAKAGTTPSKHIGFYTRNVKEAKAYYANNEILQNKYASLTDAIEAVNSQLKVMMEKN